MSDPQVLDLSEVPEVFREALDHLVYMLRMNVPARAGKPQVVAGVPFHEWREGFYKWVREYNGGPIVDDSRYTIYNGDPPLAPSLGLAWREATVPVPCPTPVRPGRYRHFKGGEYEVVGVARHTETGEPLVVYRPLYGDAPGLWARPLAMFTENVTHDGRPVSRFTPLEPAQ